MNLKNTQQISNVIKEKNIAINTFRGTDSTKTQDD